MGPERESLRALAAAQAANGDYEGAIRTAEEAVRAGDPTPEAWIADFRRGKPVSVDCPL